MSCQSLSRGSVIPSEMSLLLSFLWVIKSFLLSYKGYSALFLFLPPLYVSLFVCVQPCVPFEFALRVLEFVGFPGRRGCPHPCGSFVDFPQSALGWDELTSVSPWTCRSFPQLYFWPSSFDMEGKLLYLADSGQELHHAHVLSSCQNSMGFLRVWEMELKGSHTSPWGGWSACALLCDCLAVALWQDMIRVTSSWLNLLDRVARLIFLTNFLV